MNLRDDMAASAVVISSGTGRLSYSPRIVPGKKGQDNHCLLSAGHYLKSAVVCSWMGEGWSLLLLGICLCTG